PDQAGDGQQYGSDAEPGQPAATHLIEPLGRTPFVKPRPVHARLIIQAWLDCCRSGITVRSYSPTLMVRPAAIAKGVRVTARAVRLASHNRWPTVGSPCRAACNAPLPRISTGMYSGRISSAS